MKYTKSIIRWMFSLAAVLLACACTDDDTTTDGNGRYGFAQFQLLRQQTRSGQLEYLRDAAKIRVNLLAADGEHLSQTLNLTTYDNVSAEYGLQSDKWMLLPGSYAVVGYELFDGVEKQLLTVDYPQAERPAVQVVADGLAVQELFVDVVARGQVKFRLVKRNAEPDTRASGVDTYPFYQIKRATITVRNLDDNKETTFEKLPMTYRTVYEDKGDTDGDGDIEDDYYYTGYCTCDSLLTLPTGSYRVVAFFTFSDKTSDKLNEYCNEVAENGFEVVSYGKTEAEVPVTLNRATAYMQDAYALREIWEALDGPNWYYKGPDYPEGTNWHFDDCDIDLWLAQPGVSILSNGRVATLTLTGFGAKGDMPAALGQLTELRTLVMGTHTFNTSNGSNTPETTAIVRKHVVSAEEAERMGAAIFGSFNDDCGYNRHPLESLSEPLRQSYAELGLPSVADRPSRLQPLAATAPTQIRAASDLDVKTGYATQITSLPEEIRNLKKMTGFFYAFGPLKAMPAGFAECESVRDVQLINCPNLTEFPEAVIRNPSLSGLHFAGNSNVSPEAMYEGLKKWNELSPSFEKGTAPLSILQIPGQKCTALPDMSNLKRLGMLDIHDCGMAAIEAPFGKDHFFVKFWGQGNNFDHLPKDKNGYFMALHSEMEELNLSNNKFTELPNVFLGNSLFMLGTVDFSFNQISALEGGEEAWKGINVEILNIAYNEFTEFPHLFTEGDNCSQISYLILQGNKIETIADDAFEGRCSHWLTSLDLSLNHLTEIPVSFNGKNLPYFTGLDLSHNHFEKFIYQPLNLKSLGVYVFNGQHDRKGNRCMREWPANVWMHTGLRTLYLKGNDIRKVPDKQISHIIYLLDIRDNPNITIDMSSVCSFINAGMYIFLYDPDQDIRGCDILDLN